MDKTRFLVRTPQSRHFVDDRCANCLTEFPDDVPGLFCSKWCNEISSTVRYTRAVLRDGRYRRPDVQEALAVRNGFILYGGYASLGRELPTEVRDEIKNRDHGLCRECGKPGNEIDHVDGSSADPSNLQLLCHDCHIEKTTQRMRPASDKEKSLLLAIHLSRVLPDEPVLLGDDELAWQSRWQSLKSARRTRLLAKAEPANSGAADTGPEVEWPNFDSYGFESEAMGEFKRRANWQPR
ncbi:HNH endonuclease [Salinibacterium sp. ZJ450]|uniref:HNH endonuclease n=1 Tax=Salinibacterium sp. ZJ450 TaxID=2708338 RepID=UPI0014230225|nr:HNH endonuclease signature motif containing protein [Salinibacterium sp. ZJ450]